MLTVEQYNNLNEAYAVADSLVDDIDPDNESIRTVEMDAGDLLALAETWLFMYEALRSTGAFSVIRAPGLPPRTDRR